MKNISVEYGVIITVEEFFLKDKIMSESFINAAKEANKLRFGLLIKNETSKFYDADIGLDSDYNLKIAKIDAKYMGIIYNRNKEILKQSELLGKNIYTRENLTENWVLTNETKQIDNYLCYKATNEYIVVNPKGTFKFPVIAWYCPKLPYNFGPLGYGNLPGLILELQVRNVNYHLKKIDLNSELDFDFDFLENAKILTQEELNKKFDEFNNFEGK
jgi:GLPGLI family protein